MSDYLFSPDVVRLTIVMGVIVSMLFYERVQLTTGGSIVPPYLALALQAPVAVVSTVVAGYLTYLIVNKVILKTRIVYGRRKFEIEVLVGLAIVSFVFALRAAVEGLTDAEVMVATIGFLVPGIIAHDMFRQGPKETVIAISATTGILALFLVTFVALLPLAGVNPRPPVNLASVVGFDRRLLLVAVIVSVLLGMFLFEKLGIRSGGFITAAYVGFMLPRWADLLFLALVAFLTWVVVVKLLMPRLFLFGRRKLSTMVLFGALIGWTLELLVRWYTDGLYEPGRGLSVMTLMIPALIANDAQRQGWDRTFYGVSLGAVGVYGVMNVLGAFLLGTGLMTPDIIGDE